MSPISLSGLLWSVGLASSVVLYPRSKRCSSHGWTRPPKEHLMGTVHSSPASLVQAAERTLEEASRWDTCLPRVPDTRQKSRRLREHKGNGRNCPTTLAARSVSSHVRLRYRWTLTAMTRKPGARDINILYHYRKHHLADSIRTWTGYRKRVNTGFLARNSKSKWFIDTIFLLLLSSFNTAF